MNKLDNKTYWKTTFGAILRKLFDIYEVNDQNFSECSEREINCAITDSAVRKWFAGQRLPHKRSLQTIISYFEYLSNGQKDNKKEDCVYTTVENYFSDRHLTEFYQIKHKSKNVVDFIKNILQYCISNAKSTTNLDINQSFFAPTGKTRVVVFDFDGTLTRGKTNQTTWESICCDIN